MAATAFGHGVRRGVRRRMAGAGWSVVQTPVAAGLAWYIAHTLLGHHQPFFAPTAAALSLSKFRVLRGQRALQLIVGVVIGIGVGTAVRAVAGATPGASGGVAIGVGVLIAFVAAQALGGGFFEQGVLFVNQSVGSAILMIAVSGAATATERLSDALIGSGVTLLITVILFPAAPLSLIEDATRQVFAALRDTVTHLAELADPGDAGGAAGQEWALAAGRRIQSQLAGLEEARSAARQVANFSPRRWPQRSKVHRATERTMPLHLLATTVLSLAHTSATGSAGPAGQQPCSPALHDALGELTSAFAALAGRGDTNTAQAARHASRVRVLAAGAARAESPHAQLIATLVETCAIDTLRLTDSTAEAPRQL